MQTMWKMQKGVFESLTADTALMNEIEGVFHHTPQNSNFPYINIGESEMEDISNFTSSIFRINSRIYIFTRERSNMKLLELMDKVSSIIEQKDSITVEDHALLDSKANYTEIKLEKDGITWCGSVSSQFILEAS